MAPASGVLDCLRSEDWVFVLYLSVFECVFCVFGFCNKSDFYSMCSSSLCRFRFIIPRMVFVSPMWSKLGFEPPFPREFMLLGIWFFPIWYSDTLQETIICKRITTVADEFALQSLVGDPILVVYSPDVLCIFYGVVCLFYSTSLFGDLYVLLVEPFSAIMNFVQFYD